MSIITGNSGINTLRGSGEDDIIRGLRGNDRLEGLAGDDTLYGAQGRDTLLGGGGRDLLFGGAGNDTLYGGGGNDILVGGLGRDIMYGGAGADVFKFDDKDAGDVAAGPLSDVIADFGADDMIDLIAVDVLFQSSGSEPERGSFSIWEGGGNTYVSWYTFGGYHDIELTGYTGDVYSQIRWYDDDYTAGTNTTGSVAAGQTVTGNFEIRGDADWFGITLTAGEIYTFDLAEAFGGSAEDHYLSLGLIDADGNWLEDSYDYDGDVQLMFLAEVTGTYFIATRGDSVGAYQLKVAGETYVDDFGDDAATAGQIAAGETLTGVIAVPQDEDWFAITLTEGESYTIELRAQASGSGTLPCPSVALLDSDGNWIDWSYGYDEYDPQIVYAPEESGTYYIAVMDDCWDVGTYSLNVTADAAAPADDALLML